MCVVQKCVRSLLNVWLCVSCSRVILGSQLLTLIVKDANVAEQWAVNSAGECHVDIVEVASSILASPTKRHLIAG